MFIYNITWYRKAKVSQIKRTMWIKLRTILGLISDIFNLSTVLAFSRDCSGINLEAFAADSSKLSFNCRLFIEQYFNWVLRTKRSLFLEVLISESEIHQNLWICVYVELCTAVPISTAEWAFYSYFASLPMTKNMSPTSKEESSALFKPW